jgi:hypothetical protein
LKVTWDLRIGNQIIHWYWCTDCPAWSYDGRCIDWYEYYNSDWTTAHSWWEEKKFLFLQPWTHHCENCNFYYMQIKD